MVQVPRYGQMVLNMKENGVRIKQMVKENSGMLMVTFMKANGLMIKQTVMEYMFMLMELGMRVTGRMIYKMAGELKAGLIVQSTKENIWRE
jgi:hypothetical protein